MTSIKFEGKGLACAGMGDCQKDKAILDARRSAMGMAIGQRIAMGESAVGHAFGSGALQPATIRDARQDTVWKAVKTALQEYGRQYPKTWVGKAINAIWGQS
jgi:hypothetical protein